MLLQIKLGLAYECIFNPLTAKQYFKFTIFDKLLFFLMFSQKTFYG